MSTLSRIESIKAQYLADTLSAIKHANLTQYKKVVSKDLEHIFSLSSKQYKGPHTIEVMKLDYSFDHIQLLSLHCENFTFFSQAYTYLMDSGFKPDGLKRKNKFHYKTVLFLLNNRQTTRKYRESDLQVLFATPKLFDYKTNYSCFKHPLSLLALWKAQQLIDQKMYERIFDQVFNSNFLNLYPIYGSFTQEEIKSFNLLHTVLTEPIDEEAHWFFAKNVQEIALKSSNRKSYQVKKAIYDICFKNEEISEAKDLIDFLYQIKDVKDQIFYWGLDLFLNRSHTFFTNDLALIITRFHLFQKDKEFAATKNRVEKLFELRKDKSSTSFNNQKYKLQEQFSSMASFSDTVYSEDDEDDYLRDSIIPDDFEDYDAHHDTATLTDVIHQVIDADVYGIEYNLKDFKTMSKLHKFLSSQLDMIKSPDFDLKQDEIQGLNNSSFLNYTIVVPKTSHEFKEIGRMLDICIGTARYDKKVLRKECNIVFLVRNKRVEVCAEFCNTFVVQMKGYDNRDFKATKRKEFERLLKESYEQEIITKLDENNFTLVSRYYDNWEFDPIVD